jgi:hypothetical protein
MPRYRRYRFDKLDTGRAGERPTSWTFAGRTVTGTKFAYLVTDHNSDGRNTWEFLVRVPKDQKGRIEVRPRTVPNLRVWAGLERRSLTFTQARKLSYRGWHYCQIALADPTGTRTKHVVRGRERHDLPVWFEERKTRLREKETVRATKGYDGDELVAIVQPDEHEWMIGLFFATEVWVLKEVALLD